MTAEEMWKKFVKECNIVEREYDAWAFGDDADTLAELVRCGIKTGTSSAYPLYEVDDESLPEASGYSVILDSKDEAVCIIENTKVYVIPFCEVTPDHAFKEGEGDRSLAYWRKVHEAFFAACMEEAGLVFDENMKVVCEEFRVVYPVEK
ncbi:MAG: ASCH domain-containing protein [Roseburia sp.]|nr:ASCH domain-containing protein [Roseburia sp.]